MSDVIEQGTKASATVPVADRVVPYALLAELTHRCPLQCPYCSNPLELERSSNEIQTEDWLRVIDQAAEMGILHIHFSGGEPTVRKDLEVLVEHAGRVGLYSNLITSAVLLTRDRLERLRDMGLDHVQVSFQGTTPDIADRVAGFAGHEKKLQASRWVRELDMPLTVNAVMHRQNLQQLPDMIDMAVALDAERLEVAQVQYYGWALRNRAAFLPTREQLDEATEQVEEARSQHKGVLVIDYVVPDYYARRPKSCMGGWGRQFLNITP
ncbi:MAG TPA: pyrroloquinoline quinone biosynthesis protein PqqE, partial [Alphaproteobacteria bacterium]|nr:pyrroloquinoline quinone biosynthesis protein PqqE [Alphaproteobacteria bacterium]